MSRILAATVCLLALAAPAAFVAAGDAPEQVISGKVTDEAGAPLAGVKVSLYEIRREMLTFHVALAQSATTGPSGEFSLARVLGESTPMTITVPVVVAAKAGLALDWTTYGPGDSPDSTLVLGKPTVLAGAVIDQSGAPVEGAEVSALLMKGEMSGGQLVFGLDEMKDLAAKTGADGRFKFNNIPEGASAALVVTAPGMAKASTFQPSPDGLPHKAGATDIEIKLSKEAIVEGAVVDKETGKGIGGICLIIMPETLRDPLDIATVTSDENGAWRAAGLRPGAFGAMLMPPYDGTAEWVAATVDFTVAAGETATGVKVQLEKGGLLEVAAVDERTGEPAEGVSVTLRGPNREPTGVTTGLDGKGTVRLLPGKYTLRHAVTKERASVQLNEEIEVKSGETARAYVAIKGGFKIAGIVLDDKGAPVEGAKVDIHPVGSGSPPTTDADGKFSTTYNPDQWGSSPPPVSYIIARHAGRGLAFAGVLEGGDKPITVKLAPGVTVSGRVIEPGEKGVAGAKINLMFNGENESWGSSIESTARTDAEGRYEIPAVPAGFTYTVYAQAAGHGEAQQRFAVDASGGLRAKVDEMFLDIADKSVSGVVVDENDNPVAGARVSVSGQGQPHVQTQTDEKGAFKIEGLVIGSLYVSASHPSAQDTLGSAQANAGDENVRIVVTKWERRQVAGEPFAAQAATVLKGKPLPELSFFAPEFAAKALGKAVLVCVFDMTQRGGRRTLTDLSAKSEALAAKGVAIIALDVSGEDKASLAAWAKGAELSFAVAPAGKDTESARTDWGVKALPWLIFADNDHTVRAEGFGLDEVEGKLNEITVE